MTAREVIGRDDELEAIAAFLADLQRLPAALQLEGEPGIGKTTLWRAGVAEADRRGFRVLLCTPDETERELAYAAVSDLLDGALTEVERELPPPQRRALRIALLLEDVGDAEPDRRAIAAALRGLLQALSARSPLLVAIDDVQWVDASSAAALGFAARRLHDAPIAFLLSSRVAENGLVLPDEWVRRIAVGPLTLGALRRLLEERTGLVYPRQLLRRLHEASGGNPFYALELARVVRPEDELAPGEPLPVPPRLRDLVDVRLRTLPPGTMEVLAAAAALADPTLELLEAVVGPAARSRLTPALAAGVVELHQGGMRFAHPLFAESMRAALEPADARAVHGRLATVVDEPEQRARHYAASAEPPNEAVAQTLDEAARGARSRGAPASAAELAEAALKWTPSGRRSDFYRRTLAAAEYHDIAGEAPRARVLLEELIATEPRGHDRAVALERLARLAVGADTATRLFEQAREEADGDLALRVMVEQGLAGAKWVANSDLPDVARHLRTALRLAEQTKDDRTLARVLGALAWVETYLGKRSQGESLERALRLGASLGDLPLSDDPRWTQANVWAWTDELRRARSALETLCEDAVARDEEGALAMFLGMLGKVESWLGDWAAAVRHVDQAEELARYLELGTIRAFTLQNQVLLAALVGDVERAQSKGAEGLRVAVWTRASIRHSLGVLALSCGDAAGARDQLEEVCDELWAAGIREPRQLRQIPDAVEALVALGEPARALELLDRFENESRRLGRASGLSASARCRGLLAAAQAEFQQAEQFFEEALRCHQRVEEPFELARTLLAFGVAQRRAKRRAHARDLLGRALAIFEELGARRWAERARAELARIGGRAPASGELTATERQLAGLVAKGLTNKEIAATLFVTPKTVGTKLSRIYAKVGVHSRTELVHQLGERASKV